MIEGNKVILSDWEFEFTEQGEWISKAVPFKHKPVMPEQPHYKVVNELEERYEKGMEIHLAQSLKDIVKYLNVS